jgi:hypothetical protein
MHTPGPWTAADEWSATTDGYNISAETASEIATAYRLYFGGLDTAIANARLIAAAPDLLDVIRRLLVATDGTHETDLMPDIVKAAEAAFVKATTPKP